MERTAAHQLNNFLNHPDYKYLDEYLNGEIELSILHICSKSGEDRLMEIGKLKAFKQIRDLREHVKKEMLHAK